MSEGILVDEKAQEEVSEERQIAFDIWEQAASMGEYDPDGAVLSWMKDPPEESQLEE